MKHQARKRFGQNFLIDRQVVADIVSAIRPQPHDALVEIGPGLGALTEPLLDEVDTLHVIEIDRDIVARLQRRADPRLVIHAGDALAFDFADLARRCGRKLRVVGNLPYNISSPLLFHLAAAASEVDDLHFMLQKEVVERIVAAPGDAAYSRLSVMLQECFCSEWLLDVPPESFDPAPRVDSAVVRLIPWPAAQRRLLDHALFADLVAAAFSQRRKMLRNTLKGWLNDEEMLALGMTPTWRAEAVPVDTYVAAANWLSAARRRGPAGSQQNTDDGADRY